MSEQITTANQTSELECESYDSRIRSQYHTFTKTQRKIANFFLNNKATVLDCSITVVARKTGVNPATITRFCQSLRYSGFNELKFYMKNDLILSNDNLNALALDSSVSESTRMLLKYNVDALNDTLLLIDEQQVKKAVALITNAQKIYFYGEGGTGSSAQFGYQLFLQIGVTSNCFTDPQLMLMSTFHLSAKDVIICMSYSGCAKEVLNVMQIAKQKHCPIIAVTAYPNSPFARAANALLSYSCNIPDDLQYLHVARICEVAIIGVLQRGIVKNLLKEKQQSLNSLKQAITSKRTK